MAPIPAQRVDKEIKILTWSASPGTADITLDVTASIPIWRKSLDADVFGELLKSRNKREIIQNYHFVVLRGIFELMFKHEKDLLLFDRDSCDSTLLEEGFMCESQTLWIISSKELFAIKLALEQFEHII